jgi:hypothetical protein
MHPSDATDKFMHPRDTTDAIENMIHLVPILINFSLWAQLSTSSSVNQPNPVNHTNSVALHHNSNT